MMHIRVVLRPKLSYYDSIDGDPALDDQFICATTTGYSGVGDNLI
jgi:hypothetical protein